MAEDHSTAFLRLYTHYHYLDYCQQRATFRKSVMLAGGAGCLIRRWCSLQSQNSRSELKKHVTLRYLHGKRPWALLFQTFTILPNTTIDIPSSGADWLVRLSVQPGLPMLIYVSWLDYRVASVFFSLDISFGRRNILHSILLLILFPSGVTVWPYSRRRIAYARGDTGLRVRPNRLIKGR